MSINNQQELEGMQRVSEAVALTLRQMRAYARPGMSTVELDEYGAGLLRSMGAQSAPKLTYGFPGWTCISVNEEIAHGIPRADAILQEGDLINIDVSAELGGYWGDNGGSFVLGRDLHQHQALVDASRTILRQAIERIRGGVRIADLGRFIEKSAKGMGYTVIRNLTGHGIGRSLHEEPDGIACYYDRFDHRRFRKNSVIAIETFIATRSNTAVELPDGWTFRGNRGGYVAQHEHTILIGENSPLILTAANGIWA